MSRKWARPPVEGENDLGDMGEEEEEKRKKAEEDNKARMEKLEIEREKERQREEARLVDLKGNVK